MTDQTFDQYFVPRVRQYDRTNADDLDVGSDTWLIVEHGVQSAADGRFWFDEMPAIHAAVNGPAVTPEVLREAAQLTGGATRFLTQYGWGLYTARWQQMPWAASHYMDEATPGSYPQIVRANTAYWEFLWRRLNGDAPASAPPIYSWPAEGQTNYPVARADIESRVVITTPWGLDDATVNADNVRVIGPGDAVVPARVSRYGDHGNTVMVTFARDLAFNTEYRVTLSDQLRTLAGDRTGAVNTIRFRTRCAPGNLGDCPPLPTPLPTLTAPPVRDPRPRPDAGMPVIVMVDDAGAPLDVGAALDAVADAPAAPLDVVVARAAPATEGCSCRARAPRGASRALGLAALALVAHRRRRRRTRCAEALR